MPMKTQRPWFLIEGCIAFQLNPIQWILHRAFFRQQSHAAIAFQQVDRRWLRSTVGAAASAGASNIESCDGFSNRLALVLRCCSRQFFQNGFKFQFFKMVLEFLGSCTSFLFREFNWRFNIDSREFFEKCLFRHVVQPTFSFQFRCVCDDASTLPYNFKTQPRSSAKAGIPEYYPMNRLARQSSPDLHHESHGSHKLLSSKNINRNCHVSGLWPQPNPSRAQSARSLYRVSS